MTVCDLLSRIMYLCKKQGPLNQVLNPPSYHIPPLNKKRKIKLINGIVLFVEINKPNELPMMAKERKIIGAD